jgi:hypothetical protein
MNVTAMSFEEAERLLPWQRQHLRRKGIDVPKFPVGREALKLAKHYNFPEQRKITPKGAGYGCKRKVRDVVEVPEWKSWFNE